LSLLLLGVSLFALTGCGPKRMKSDFIGFEKAYAETSNREVLLNLARLQNHDTTYFFKLGQISSSYRMAATLSGSGNYVIQGAGSGGNATGGGTPGLTFENDPSFTFIPVNDDVSAQLLLKPVPAETLYNLYLQGWRADQLFRLLVDRIEVTAPNANGQGCTVKTFRNVPPAVRSGAGSDSEYLRDASSYAVFLRVSAVVYGLQKHGHLLLKGTTAFVPYDAKSMVGAAETAAPKATDVAAAALKGQSWEFDGKQWLLGQQVFGAKFYLNDPDNIRQDLLSDDRLQGLENGESLQDVLTTLASGFSIEEATSGGSADDCVPTGITSHLVMRSLIGLMAAVAQEQAPFDALVANPALLPAASPKDKQMTFGQAVPPIERLPSLRLKWVSADKNGPPLVEVNYRGGNYLIADSNNLQIPDDQYWNRDMFRLINQLTAQVTVDISKFPLPGILRLNTN